MSEPLFEIGDSVWTVTQLVRAAGLGFYAALLVGIAWKERSSSPAPRVAR